jgi:AbrB family looped-hinge helix DNA binding protein
LDIARLKEKGQITIPAALREKLNAQSGDFFSASVKDGAIILKPQTMGDPLLWSDNPQKNLSSWYGSAKSVYASVEEIDAFIRAERDQWD